MKKLSATIMVIICMFIPFISAIGADNTNADEIYKKLADNLSRVEKKLPNKTVAIYGFEVIGRSGDQYAKFATEKLTHQLVSNGSLMVIERSRIDQILKEQSLSMTGVIDAGKAAQIGKILSVDAVIIGSIHVTEKDVEFIVRVIQSERGIILASANEKLITESSSGGSNDQADNNITDNTYKGTAVIKLNKTIYTRFEQVTVSYSGLPGNQNDWITLISASASDSTYGEWFYTYGQKSGSYTFKVSEPGDYEVRVYYDWPNGGYVVRQRIKIKVK